MVKDNDTVIKYPSLSPLSPSPFSHSSRSVLPLPPLPNPHITNPPSTREFNELVNMTASELKEWLKSESSTSSGWSKDDGSGETVGHDSGNKIVAILEKNSDRDPEGYAEGMWSYVFVFDAWMGGRMGRKEGREGMEGERMDGWKADELIDDIPHMRKVVSYCKRHLAQEETAKRDTESKSYKSLKNWGHDAQKTA